MLQARILIADDEPAHQDLFRNAILMPEPSWVVEVARDGREALRLLRRGRFDVAVLDLLMPHRTGMEVLKAVQEEGIPTDMIILTGYGDVDIAVEAMKSGAKDFVEKQALRIPEFIDRVRRVLKDRIPPHAMADRLDAFLQECCCSDPDLRVDRLCEEFHVSTRYVSRLFREHLGVTFPERLAHHRVQRAKQLLETTGETLDCIADQCGFKGRQRLSEAFRKQEGMAPRQYRKICAEKRTFG
jgi:YesN/AraC family two-component response regulator